MEIGTTAQEAEAGAAVVVQDQVAIMVVMVLVTHMTQQPPPSKILGNSPRLAVKTEVSCRLKLVLFSFFRSVWSPINTEERVTQDRNAVSLYLETPFNLPSLFYLPSSFFDANSF